MRRALVPTICALPAFALAATALASPVSEFRDGLNASLDVRAATVTATGAASFKQVITDDLAAPICVPKARGTLDFDVDLANLGFPVSIPVTLVGTELSPTRVQWDASVDVNQCVEATLPDGTPINVLIRQVVVRLTGDLASSPATLEPYCVARRGVSITTVGGDAANSMDVTAYGLCLQTTFTRIDIDVRDIDAVAAGGDDPCPADTNADDSVNFSDLNVVLAQFGAQAAPGELGGDVNLDGDVNFSDLNAVLAAFGADCSD